MSKKGKLWKQNQISESACKYVLYMFLYMCASGLLYTLMSDIFNCIYAESKEKLASFNQLD